MYTAVGNVSICTRDEAVGNVSICTRPLGMSLYEGDDGYKELPNVYIRMYICMHIYINEYIYINIHVS